MHLPSPFLFLKMWGFLKVAPADPAGIQKWLQCPFLKIWRSFPEDDRGHEDGYFGLQTKWRHFPPLPQKHIIQGQGVFISHIGCSWSPDAGGSSLPALRGDADVDAVLTFVLSEFGSFSEQFFNLKMKIFPFPMPAFASYQPASRQPNLRFRSRNVMFSSGSIKWKKYL